MNIVNVIKCHLVVEPVLWIAKLVLATVELVPAIRVTSVAFLKIPFGDESVDYDWCWFSSNSVEQTAKSKSERGTNRELHCTQSDVWVGVEDGS